jgi:nitrate reductase (cytochrome)
MNRTDRREFLKRMALASAAATATALVPGVFFGEEVLRAAGSVSATVWRKAPCRFCAAGCGLLIGIEDGRAVAVKGDPDSPVNKGLACVKGYHAVQAFYGRDRITRAMVRRDGRLVPVPLQEALDLVARRLGESVASHGKDSVALYGSGQWSIPTAYVAAKLFKGALGTNNLDANARLTSGSAMAGLRSSFGLDAPLGCFEDLDHADVFVLWNTNLAEEHPVLFSRLLERRRTSPSVRIVDLSTRTSRTSYAADRSLLFAPQSDLAIANAICQEIVARGWVNRDFVERHVALKKGRTRIGYGTSEDGLVAEAPADASWNEFVRAIDAYTPEAAQRLSGVAAGDIRWLASLYADRGLRVVSIWGAGVNQHVRGTWLNNLIHDIHLLVGKIATPGSGPLSLGDQPSGCGSVREVGALTDRLPSGPVESEAGGRGGAEVRRVPLGNLDPVPSHHALSMFRAFGRGEIRFLWVQGSNPMVSLPNLSRYRESAAGQGQFLVVSDVYPTPTTDVADVVLPSALWLEQEGIYGSAERRTQHFEQMLSPPGDATSDTWQLIEVARRLGFAELFPWASGNYVEGIWTEYGRFRTEPSDRLAPLAELRERPGILWPYVAGQETRWRYNTAHDPATDRSAGAFDFYGNPDRRAWIWIRPHEAAAESPDAEFPFWLETGRVLEHAGTGSLTRRIPVLHQAVPGAYVEVNAEDGRRLGIRDGDRVRLVSRRGSLLITARIDLRGQPAPGRLFVPSFDESILVNQLTLDAFCPLSGQPDYMKCAVRVESTRSPAG